MINHKKRLVMISFVLLMLTSTVSVAYMATPVSAQSSNDWPMFRHDPSFNGYSTSAAPSQWKIGWKYEAGESVRSSPAVVGGKVYVGCDDNNVYCLDGATGSLKWKYQTGDAVVSSPAVVNGKVYVGSADTYVYCLNAENGNMLWKFKTGYYVYSSPCVTNGKVYIASNDKKIYCLNAENGDLVWNFTTLGTVSQSGGVAGSVSISIYIGSPAVVDGRVYVGSFDRCVYCLDASNGNMIWRYNTTVASARFGIYGSSPAVANGKVYIGADDGYLYCINAADGKLVWNYVPPSDPSIGATTTWAETSPAVDPSGNVYFGFAHYIMCFNGSTGKQKWQTYSGITMKSSPALADGKLYEGCQDRYFYCINITDGNRLQSFGSVSAIFSSPAVADGKVYVGGEDDNIYCFVAGEQKIIPVSSVNIQPRTIPIGDAANVEGSISSRGWSPAGATVTLTYTKPDGSNIERKVQTNDKGAFTDDYKPDAQGTWKVQAKYDGSEAFEPATSIPQKFYVVASETKTSSTTSVSVSANSVALGKSVTVSGGLSASTIGLPVKLTYTKPDGTTMERNSLSGGCGAFSDTMTPNAEGTWSVQASYAGSDVESGSTSNAVSFSVTAAGTTPQPSNTQGNTPQTTEKQEGTGVFLGDALYVAIAVLVIAVIAIAVYVFVKRRK